LAVASATTNCHAASGGLVEADGVGFSGRLCDRREEGLAIAMPVKVTTHTTVYSVVPERITSAKAFGGTGTFVFTQRRDALEYHNVNRGKILTASLAPHVQERIDDFALELLHVNEWREGDPLVFGNDGSSGIYPAGTQLYVRDPSLFSDFGRLVRKVR
jgi:hypothetical protein